jgi:hypothetical protein
MGANMTEASEKKPGLPARGAESNLLGRKLVAAKLITDPQLSEALER